ncbi:MAG: reverse transcriptase domain-containing protein, partial [Mycobacterium sp.]
MSVDGAMHQKSGQPGPAATRSGEAARRGTGDEAPLGRHEPMSSGSALLEAALKRENLMAAWKRVKANQGSAGVDGRSIEATGAYLKQHWPQIREALLRGTYRPCPVRRVAIPKPDGGERELGIPTVLDRLIQQALLQVLQPLIDPTFSPHSYGFRPGRGCKDALRRVDELLKQGHVYVVDADLKSYFDSIPHAPLMARLETKIADGSVLK